MKKIIQKRCDDIDVRHAVCIESPHTSLIITGRDE